MVRAKVASVLARAKAIQSSRFAALRPAAAWWRLRRGVYLGLRPRLVWRRAYGAWCWGGPLGVWGGAGRQFSRSACGFAPASHPTGQRTSVGAPGPSGRAEASWTRRLPRPSAQAGIASRLWRLGLGWAVGSVGSEEGDFSRFASLHFGPFDFAQGRLCGSVVASSTRRLPRPSAQAGMASRLWRLGLGWGVGGAGGEEGRFSRFASLHSGPFDFAQGRLCGSVVASSTRRLPRPTAQAVMASRLWRLGLG